MSFAAGSGECLAPLTISEILFLHERGTVMAWYTASLNFGGVDWDYCRRADDDPSQLALHLLGSYGFHREAYNRRLLHLVRDLL